MATPSEIAVATALLKKRGWLSTLPAGLQDALLAQCRWCHHADGAVIILAGEESGGFFGIASGSIASMPGSAPVGTLPIDIRFAPVWAGTGPVSGRPRIAIVIARGQVLAAHVPQHVFNALAVEHPDLWRHLNRLTLEMFTLAYEALGDTLIRDSRRRCVAVLLRLGDCRVAGDAPVDVCVAHDELAGLANLSRQSAGLILRRLEAENWISTGYRVITLRDPPGLRALLAADQ